MRIAAALPRLPHLQPLLAALMLALLGCLHATDARAAELADEVNALLARGEGAAALALAQKAVAARPADVQARFLHGVALMELGRDADAMAHFSAMAQDYPELPDPLNNLALLHARAGRLEMARQALEQALRNDPRHRLARSNLGQVHLMLAVQAWELAAAAAPGDAPLLQRLQAARALLKTTPTPGR